MATSAKIIRFKESGKFYDEEIIPVPEDLQPWTVREFLKLHTRFHGFHICFPDEINPWKFPLLVLKVG